MCAGSCHPFFRTMASLPSSSSSLSPLLQVSLSFSLSQWKGESFPFPCFLEGSSRIKTRGTEKSWRFYKNPLLSSSFPGENNFLPSPFCRWFVGWDQSPALEMQCRAAEKEGKIELTDSDSATFYTHTALKILNWMWTSCLPLSLSLSLSLSSFGLFQNFRFRNKCICWKLLNRVLEGPYTGTSSGIVFSIIEFISLLHRLKDKWRLRIIKFPSMFGQSMQLQCSVFVIPSIFSCNWKTKNIWWVTPSISWYALLLYKLVVWYR